MDTPPNLLLCAAGMALCLCGWTLYWGGLHTLGAAIGAAGGAALGWVAVDAGEITEYRTVVVSVTGVLGALLGLFLFRRLHFGALAVAGAVLGLVGGLQGCVAVREFGARWAEGDVALAVSAAGGVALGAMLAIVLHRWVIVFLTSAAGAVLLDAGVSLDTPLLVPLVAFVLAILFQGGIVRRLGLGQQRRAQERNDE